MYVMSQKMSREKSVCNRFKRGGGSHLSEGGIISCTSLNVYNIPHYPKGSEVLQRIRSRFWVNEDVGQQNNESS